VFTPETGSALTDASGVATVSVKPASTTSSGAVGITATSVVATKTAAATTNISVGAAPLTVGTLSFSPAPSGALPAFSTLALSFPITSGGAAASEVAGLSMTSLCQGDGTATLVRGTYANGVQSATYTNNGCLRGKDVITVSIGNSTQTIEVAVGSANIGSIQFSGSSVSGSSIVLKGSGGVGRSESAQLSFRVLDQNGNGLPGVDVDFTATTTTGGLVVSPKRATTDASGNVSTMVASGTIPTPVRVTAEASRNNVKMSGLSDQLTISTGLPIQSFMSMSAEKFNIEGLDYDGETTAITVRMADQFGNPVSDGTAVTFVTEGGSIGTAAQGACESANGGCTVQLSSQEFRPLDGRVTVLSYSQGIENFVDANGDGQYTCGGWNSAALYRPLVDICPPETGEKFPDPSTGMSGDMGDPFLDANFDGVYDANNGDRPFPYNHASYSAVGDKKWGLNYIRRSFEVTFSGSVATLMRQVCPTNGVCRDWTAADGDSSVITGVSGAGCKVGRLNFRIYDRNGNPMPADTTVTSSNAVKLAPSAGAPTAVGSTSARGGTFHQVLVTPDTECSAGSFIVNITTPRGVVTQFPFSSN